MHYRKRWDSYNLRFTRLVYLDLPITLHDSIRSIFSAPPPRLSGFAPGIPPLHTMPPLPAVSPLHTDPIRFTRTGRIVSHDPSPCFTQDESLTLKNNEVELDLLHRSIKHKEWRRRRSLCFSQKVWKNSVQEKQKPKRDMKTLEPQSIYSNQRTVEIKTHKG